MAEHQLVGLLIAHVGNVERPRLVAQYGIKHHMLHHVAQFFLDIVQIMTHQGIGQFKHLFYRICSQALVCLFFIPRTFLSQRVEHIEKTPEGL